MKKPFLVAGIIAILLFLGGVVWYTSKPHSFSEQTPSQETQSSVVDNEPLSTPPAEEYPQHIVAIPNSDQVWYEIPELGVRMKLNKEFADDLIYATYDPMEGEVSKYDAVDFSLKTLVDAFPLCGPRSSDLGGITKFKDVPQDSIDARKGLSFSIGSQSVCWYGDDEIKAKSILKKQYSGSGAQSLKDGFETVQWMKLEK